ncbi:MFS transporter [Pseudonocardia phyllosphaerae]|uniref:MFS transporter n=1 Tax=Pseudonocardia phyllosphaerae TaxID=3390502 RepID=UPI0039794A91
MGGSGSTDRSPGRVALASFLGTTVEWYDYFLFGTAAVLVLNRQFFPSLSPAAGTLAAFATFSVAFVARPLGSLVFGHYGDRLSRKKMLVFSLVGMGAATVAVGLLPGFGTIGVAAPVLLVTLRLLQGIAVGGEWGGASLMALEHAPEGRRAFYASWAQAGVPAGTVLATGAFALAGLLPDEQFDAWGWRIPFLASALLIGVGLWIRLRIEESPELARAHAEQAAAPEPAPPPLLDVLRDNKKAVLIGALSVVGGNTVYYLATVYMLSLGPQTFGFPRSTVLLAIMAAAIVDVAVMPCVALLADRIGRRRLLQLGAVLGIVVGVPMFAAFETGTPWGILLATMLALPIGHAFSSAVVTSYIPGLFPAGVRYTGAGLAYQVSGIIASAPAPFMATLLFSVTGSSLTVGAYLSVVSLVALVAITVGPRTSLDRDVAAEPAPAPV